MKLQRDLSPANKALRLQQINRSVDVANRELAFYLAEMDQKGEHQALGYPSSVHYAVDRLEMTPRRARELSQLGRELENLPEIDEAFGKGELSGTHPQGLEP